MSLQLIKGDYFQSGFVLGKIVNAYFQCILVYKNYIIYFQKGLFLFELLAEFMTASKTVLTWLFQSYSNMMLKWH